MGFSHIPGSLYLVTKMAVPGDRAYIVVKCDDLLAGKYSQSLLKPDLRGYDNMDNYMLEIKIENVEEDTTETYLCPQKSVKDGNIEEKPLAICKKELEDIFISNPKTGCKQRVYKCDDCERCYLNQVSFGYHRLDKHPSVCSYCGWRFVEPSSLESHLQLHCELAKETFENNECYATQADSVDEEMNPETHTKIEIVDSKPVEERKEENMVAKIDKFTCYVCGQIFVKKMELIMHLLITHKINKGKVLQQGANIREEIVDSKPVEERKEENVVEKIDKFTCYVCGQIFVKKSELSMHLLNIHKVYKGEVLQPGAYIREEIVDSEPVEERKKENTVAKIDKFTCYVCGQIFVKKSELSMHLLNIHKVYKGEVLQPGAYIREEIVDSKPVEERKEENAVARTDEFTCYVCGQIFVKISELSMHLLNFHKVYKGEVLQPRAYIREEIVDSEPVEERKKENMNVKIDKFTCYVCGQIFVKKSELSMHLLNTHKVNKGEVLQPGAYIREEIVDSEPVEERKEENMNAKIDKFTCNVCGKAFLKKMKLKIHLLIVHKVSQGEVLWYNDESEIEYESYTVCNLCKQTYRDSERNKRKCEIYGFRDKTAETCILFETRSPLTCSLCEQIFPEELKRRKCEIDRFRSKEAETSIQSNATEHVRLNGSTPKQGSTSTSDFHTNERLPEHNKSKARFDAQHIDHTYTNSESTFQFYMEHNYTTVKFEGKHYDHNYTKNYRKENFSFFKQKSEAKGLFTDSTLQRLGNSSSEKSCQTDFATGVKRKCKFPVRVLYGKGCKTTSQVKTGEQDLKNELPVTISADMNSVKTEKTEHETNLFNTPLSVTVEKDTEGVQKVVKVTHEEQVSTSLRENNDLQFKKNSWDVRENRLAKKFVMGHHLDRKEEDQLNRKEENQLNRKDKVSTRESKPYTFECCFCEKWFMVIHLLKRHLENSHYLLPHWVRQRKCSLQNNTKKQYRIKKEPEVEDSSIAVRNPDVKMVSNNKQKIYFCEICNRKFSYRFSLKLHLSKMHGTEPLDYMKVLFSEVSDENKTCTCCLCCKNYGSRLRFFKHLIDFHRLSGLAAKMLSREELEIDTNEVVQDVLRAGIPLSVSNETVYCLF